MLGQREPEIYGHATLDDVRILCEETAQQNRQNIDFRQSNYEGELVTWIQQEIHNIDGLIINAGAYTHTSIAIHDALQLLSVPVIEVHISNPKERENFRHVSYIELVADKVFAGHGINGYKMALDYLTGKGR
jgi:3-dehydroquinate dehydratase-2